MGIKETVDQKSAMEAVMVIARWWRLGKIDRWWFVGDDGRVAVRGEGIVVGVWGGGGGGESGDNDDRWCCASSADTSMNMASSIIRYG